jgi:hypothetical protein
MAQYFEYLEKHEPGSGKWEAHCTEAMLTTREALEIIAAMNEVFPGLEKSYEGHTTVWRCKYDGSPVFAIKY